MTERLLVSLDADGQAEVALWPDEGLPEPVTRTPLAWPLDADALEDLRWYLEDYLSAPFGVWEDRGPVVREMLAGWGKQIFQSVFGSGPARNAYQRARDRGLEVVFRSAEPGLLALPWELMRDEAGPVALGSGISRTLRVAGAGTLEVPGGRLRVLMVIARPAGTADVGYRTVARPLLERLDAVRGQVTLTVLRPPTFDAMAKVVRTAAEAGEPFHLVHIDGHGAMAGRAAGEAILGGRPATMTGAGEGVLAFERPGGGSDYVSASKLAEVLAAGRVPVVVLNASQSGAIGRDLEASVAANLLRAGCAAVVAMAYSVYAVAAAEFMAVFYESLFNGDSLGQAVIAGRRHLFEYDLRPSPRGDLPLADWLVPVHYLRREVRFPAARTGRPGTAPSLDVALGQLRTAQTVADAAADPLAPANAFVGRDDLFYQLETAASLHHVIVLTGPGGTGKTELAKGFGRWWRDTGGVADPRLVFWHSFKPGVATFGLDRVITEIGLQVFGTDFARLAPEERLEAVKQLLGQYRALLLWDNFESVREMPGPGVATPALDAASHTALRDFLEWVQDHSASVVIITSRAQEDWLGQARRIVVGGLNRTEAAEYATYLLSASPAAQVQREQRSFTELLDWLDGSPLAMRVALPLLKDTDPAVLLAGLRGATPVIDTDTSTEHLSALAASISYSFTYLPDHAQRLLPALSLFHEVAYEDALAAFSEVETVPSRFAGISGEEWSAVLSEAARVGLLTGLGAGMYRMHPALPGYLATAWQAASRDRYDQEREAGEQALRTTYAAFSQWLTDQIGSGDAGLAYALIELQEATLSAMLSHALAYRVWQDAEDIVRALDAYLAIRGLGEEADAWAAQILDAIADLSRVPVESASSLWLHVTIEQASRQMDAGRLDEAGQTYVRALAYLKDRPATEWTRDRIAVIYHQLGMTAQGRGQLHEAEDWYRKALVISEELSNRPGMASSYHQLGRAAQGRGQLHEAEDWYRKALAISEELGNRPGMAITYHQLGTLAKDQGRLEEADDWYRRSLAIREESGDSPGMAAIYHQLGMTAQQRGSLDDAEEMYRSALSIEEALNDRPGMSSTYHQLGISAQLKGQLDGADEWYHKALDIEQELGDRTSMAAIYHQLGMTAEARGQLTEAAARYDQSLAIKEELGNRPGMALTLAQLGRLEAAQGHSSQALDLAVRCVALFSEFPHPLTGTGPDDLTRLTSYLGMKALETAWRSVTGTPLPDVVRRYVQEHQESGYLEQQSLLVSLADTRVSGCPSGREAILKDTALDAARTAPAGGASRCRRRAACHRRPPTPGTAVI